MTRFLKLAIIPLVILLGGCQGNPGKGDATVNAGITTEAYRSEASEFFFTGSHAENDTTLLRVAILGDAEPKPLAEFPNMAAAVEQINALAQSQQIDFAGTLKNRNFI